MFLTSRLLYGNQTPEATIGRAADRTTGCERYDRSARRRDAGGKRPLHIKAPKRSSDGTHVACIKLARRRPVSADQSQSVA
jgi:hypothetical protein